MPVVFIRHIGQNFAFIHAIEGIVDPGFGGGGGVDPGYGRPEIGWGHPDQGLPGGRPGHVSPPIYHPGHPDHGLPSAPARPDNSLPGSPGHPDARPPSQPPTVAPGATLVLVRDQMGIWHYHELAPGSAPPKPVPVPPLPPGYVSGQPVPPPPTAGTPPVTPAPAPTAR
jgi:hypothetical protein